MTVKLDTLFVGYMHNTHANLFVYIASTKRGMSKSEVVPDDL